MSATQVIAPVAIHNILFATDFSAASNNAARYAALFARQSDATIVIMHVLPSSLQPDLDNPAHPIDLHGREAQRKLLRTENRQEFSGVPHQVMLKRGELWWTIADVVNSNLIDIIVVGTHGRSGLKKLLLGSEAEAILQRSRVPVLTVGPAADRNDIGFDRILCCTDLSPGSEAALAFAASLAGQPERRLTLLHVISHAETGADQSRDVPSHAESVRDRLLGSVASYALPVAPEVVVHVGHVAPTILRTAAERKTDLVVLGAGTGAAARGSTHLPWSVTHKVVAHACCPVLTVRAAPS